MKTNKIFRGRFLTKAALTGIALTGLLGAFTVPASADSSSASYEYHIGDAFLVSLDPSFGPDVTLAPNGASMTVTGTGTLSVHPKSISGGGTFSYANAAGDVLASGTWTAQDLLSFKVYGTSPILPPTFTAGKAYVRVHLSPQAGGPGFGAILTITCALPDVKVPQSAEEGIRLAVQRIGNFNDEVSGNTLFILLP